VLANQNFEKNRVGQLEEF